jgi:heavy metal sensor kinase
VRIRSIRARLTLWYMSLLTLTFLLLGGAAYGLLSYSLIHEVDNALSGVANVLAQQVHNGENAPMPPDLNEIFRRFFGFSPWEPYFQMLNPPNFQEPGNNGARSNRFPLSPQAARNAARGLSTFETMKGAGKYPTRVLTMPVMEGGRLNRLVRVGMSLGSVSATHTRFLLIMAALLPPALLLAGLGGWLLARSGLRPVDRMTEAAERISAEHLAERLEETGAGDELDRLARTMNQMLARLDAAFSQIRQFSANASHELQTPITILKGELEVALRSGRSPEDYQATLKSALEEIDRIANLVEGLLIIARTEAGVFKIDRQPVSLARTAEEVYWRLKVLADKRGVNLVLDVDDSIIIPGDRERLRRLIMNLVDNGIKYTGSGGRVSIVVQRDDPWICLEVSDTGIGISEEDRERIFQPFYRSSEVIAERGSGLGLCIAQSIALAHGGQIEVHSTPGIGSSFRVLLPGISRG